MALFLGVSRKALIRRTDEDGDAEQGEGDEGEAIEETQVGGTLGRRRAKPRLASSSARWPILPSRTMLNKRR